MLPLTLLLSLNPAHAVDITLSDAPFNGNLQLALDAVNAGDVLIIDSFVSGQGLVTKTANGGFTIRGSTPCTSVAAGCPWGWGNGTSMQLTGNGSSNVVVLQDLAVDGPNGDVDADGTFDEGLNILDKDARLVRMSFTGFDQLADAPDRGTALTWNAGPDNVIEMDSCFVGSNAGPAVRIFGGDAEIYDSTFDSNGNEYAIFGYGVRIGDQEQFYGSGLQFIGDEITLGEAFLDDPADNNSTITKRGNRFVNNVAVYGGGAYIEANEGRIDGNRFEYNVANDYFLYNDRIELNTAGGLGVSFVGNGLGGGMFVGPSGTTGTLNIRWNTFASNWGWDGAGVHIQNPEDVRFTNNLVAQNWAVHVGGGLSIIHDNPSSTSRPEIINNTLVGNIAGLTRALQAVQVVGGGGGARIEGLIPEFKNNVVSHSSYGGGMLGKVADGPFEAGDDFNTWFRSNLFYYNCDVDGCQPGGSGDSPLVGNYNQYALHPSNVVDIEPEYIYFGDPRESSVLSDNDAYPDVFCLNAFSIGIGAGDPAYPNLGDSSYGSDVGHCGGVECFFWNRDRDGDGWLQHQDCLDDPEAVFPGRPAPADINPAAIEECDYEDNNCNGVIDENFTNKWFIDEDGDGGGDSTDPGVLACDPSDLPGGTAYVDNNDDCNDGDLTIRGAFAEVCDGVDNDCDKLINEEAGLEASALFADQDLDGFGAQAREPVLVCSVVVGSGETFYPVTPTGEDPDFLVAPIPPFDYGFYPVGDDCNDGDATIKPDAEEQCDPVDRNCNQDPYDVADGESFYLDSDGDGWGDLTTAAVVCDGQPLPEGNYVPNGGDCDETNAAINNGADEICDGLDNDCNQIVDDNPVDGELRYEDFDNDGFGNPATALRACPGSHGATYTATVGGDCDDNDAAVGECSECGCQATPTPGSMGVLTTGLLALFGLRRRRR